MTGQKKTEVFRLSIIVYIDRDASGEPDPIATIDCEIESESPIEANKEMLRKIIKIRDDNPKATDLKFRATLKDSEESLIGVYDDELD